MMILKCTLKRPQRGEGGGPGGAGGPASAQIAANQGGGRARFDLADLAIGLERFVVRDRVPTISICNNCHLFSVARASRNVRRDCAGRGSWAAPDQGEIGAIYIVRSEEIGKPFMGSFRLRDDQDTRRVFVDAMDDSRPFDPANAGKLAFTVM